MAASRAFAVSMPLRRDEINALVLTIALITDCWSEAPTVARTISDHSPVCPFALTPRTQ